MNRVVQKTIISLFVVTFAVILMAGCQEEQNTSVPGSKQCRLIAAENLELKKELSDCQQQLEQKTEQLKTSKKAGGERADSLVKALMDENSKLQSQIRQLQQQLGKK